MEIWNCCPQQAARKCWPADTSMCFLTAQMALDSAKDGNHYFLWRVGTCLVTQSCLTVLWLHGLAHWASLFMAFPRQKYWNGLSFPSPGDLLDPEIKPGSPALQEDSLLTEQSGKPLCPIDWRKDFSLPVVGGGRAIKDFCGLYLLDFIASPHIILKCNHMAHERTLMCNYVRFSLWYKCLIDISIAFHRHAIICLWNLIL